MSQIDGRANPISYLNPIFDLSSADVTMTYIIFFKINIFFRCCNAI